MNPFSIFIAIAAAAFIAGYHLRDLQADAEQARAVSYALAKADALNQISRLEEIDLIKAQQKTEVVYKTITKEVPKYVSVIQKTDSDCNLSHGTVRLLNSAALERLPEAARNDDPRDTESSSVTEARLIDYNHEVIDQYNKVKNQCNGLIQWHKKQTVKD